MRRGCMYLLGCGWLMLGECKVQSLINMSVSISYSITARFMGQLVLERCGRLTSIGTCDEDCTGCHCFNSGSCLHRI